MSDGLNLQLKILQTLGGFLLLLLGQEHLTLSLSNKQPHLLLEQQLVTFAAVLMNSQNPSAQGLAGLADLPYRLWLKMGALNDLFKLLELFSCYSAAVKILQLLERKSKLPREQSRKF